jgi:hypothetical protein
MAILVSPLLLAYPLYYWVFNLAGEQFVTTRLSPEDRAVHLDSGYKMLMAMVVCLTCFLGLMLLFIGGYRRKITGWLLIPAGLLFVPGVILAWFIIGLYFGF